MIENERQIDKYMLTIKKNLTVEINDKNFQIYLTEYSDSIDKVQFVLKSTIFISIYIANWFYT